MISTAASSVTRTLSIVISLAMVAVILSSSSSSAVSAQTTFSPGENPNSSTNTTTAAPLVGNSCDVYQTRGRCLFLGQNCGWCSGAPNGCCLELAEESRSGDRCSCGEDTPTWLTWIISILAIVCCCGCLSGSIYYCCRHRLNGREHDDDDENGDEHDQQTIIDENGNRVPRPNLAARGNILNFLSRQGRVANHHHPGGTGEGLGFYSNDRQIMMVRLPNGESLIVNPSTSAGNADDTDENNSNHLDSVATRNHRNTTMMFFLDAQGQPQPMFLPMMPTSSGSPTSRTNIIDEGTVAQGIPVSTATTTTAADNHHRGGDTNTNNDDYHYQSPQNAGNSSNRNEEREKESEEDDGAVALQQTDGFLHVRPPPQFGYRGVASP